MLQQMVLPPHPHRQHQMDSVGLKAKYMKLEWKKAAGGGGRGGGYMGELGGVGLGVGLARKHIVLGSFTST